LPASAEAQQSREIEIIGDEPMESPEPQPLLTEAVEDPDADRKVELPDELRSKGSSLSSVHDDLQEFKRFLGEKALKEEAKSTQHLLTHIPKNPLCDVCQRAKMFKPPSRTDSWRINSS
jgi:hypothetical protein